MSAQPSILISSSVYDKEGLLDQVFSVLKGIGYDVWMSSKGTLPINPELTAFENCLDAVEKCDLFLGIISGYYGSGTDGNENSITHQEFTKAIALNKLRWFLVDSDVIVIRNLVKAIRRLEEIQKTEICSKIPFKQTDPISDIRILQMYNEATRTDLPLRERKGNWVQNYKSTYDVLQFIKTQLGDPERYSARQ